MLDQAFDLLKTYDWSGDRKALNPIDEAVAAAGTDPDARRKLETRLIAVLAQGPGRAAVDFICRQLMLVGSPSPKKLNPASA